MHRACCGEDGWGDFYAMGGRSEAQLLAKENWLTATPSLAGSSCSPLADTCVLPSELVLDQTTATKQDTSGSKQTWKAVHAKRQPVASRGGGL